MTMPIFLHLAVPAKRRRDYVAELSAATQHLGLGIKPESNWSFAMSRIRAIGSASFGIRRRIEGTLTLQSEVKEFSLVGGISGNISTEGQTLQLSGGGVIPLSEPTGSFNLVSVG